MMNRIRCLFMEGVEGGFQFVGSQSLVVFVQEAIHLVEDVEALQSVDEVVAHQRVVVGLIDAEGVLPVRLYQISVVIILVGEVEIADERGLTETVEEVAPKRKQRVVDLKG